MNRYFPDEYIWMVSKNINHWFYQKITNYNNIKIMRACSYKKSWKIEWIDIRVVRMPTLYMAKPRFDIQYPIY